MPINGLLQIRDPPGQFGDIPMRRNLKRIQHLGHPPVKRELEMIPSITSADSRLVPSSFGRFDRSGNLLSGLLLQFAAHQMPVD